RMMSSCSIRWRNSVSSSSSDPTAVPSGAVLQFDLMQSLVDLRSRSDSSIQDGTALVQNYNVTNVSDSEFSFEVLRYLDGDLFSSGVSGATDTPLADGGGAGLLDPTRSTITLFQTDEGTGAVVGDPTIVGIQSTAVGGSGFAPWEVGIAGDDLPMKPAGELLMRIVTGQPLRNDVIPSSADSDDNGILDSGEENDVAVAHSEEFLDVAPGDTVRFVTVTIFGHAPMSHTPPGPGLASIEGEKFLDSNGNGDFDSGEVGQEGVTIFADQNQNGAFDQGEPFAITSAGGFYSLAVPVGTHMIREVVPSGFSQTFPPSGFHSVTVSSPGQLVSGINFGNASGVGSLTGFKFEDENGNGLFDSFESSLSGVTVFLDQNDNSVLDPNEASTTTDAFGDYLFSNLAPGSYIVREIPPAGSQQTFPSGDGAHRVTLSSGETISGLNFGNTFADDNVVSVGDGPVDVIAADVNGDGIDDIITANSLSDDVSVVLGLGGGAFGTSTEFPAGSEPTAVKAADLDLDGDLDLIVALAFDSSVAVLPNSGGGSFGSPLLFDAGGEQGDVVVFNFSGGSGPEILVTLPFSDEVAVLPNLGPGIAFGSPSFFPTSGSLSGAFPDDMAAGDLDGDGLLDLAVVNESAETLAVLRNLGGDFDAPVELSTGEFPNGVAIGDFNFNGANDLAVANETDGSVTVFYNNVFPTSATFSVPGMPVAITTGSFQNGFLDLAVALETDNSVAFLENDGDGGFPTSTQAPVGMAPLAVFGVNLDNDFTSDLLAANFADDTVSIVLNAGEGEPESLAPRTTGIDAEFASVPEDIDRNGRVEMPDLLVLVNAFRSEQVRLAEAFGREETFDASRNGVISLDDLLQVVQYLRGGSVQAEGEGEDAADSRVPLSVSDSRDDESRREEETPAQPGVPSPSPLLPHRSAAAIFAAGDDAGPSFFEQDESTTLEDIASDIAAALS
ncbi:MAG: VCBS repeat-containing protein, partial [Planctomycetes bacterium]|nr:VCBS repeat-containing protein [Planctomycetota bacterium]